MSGQRVGYIRVSTFDQNENRQLQNLELHKIFIDKASGKDVNRPQFQELLRYVRNGDVVIVHSLDRLARNLQDLLTIVKKFTEDGICVEFIQEGLKFGYSESPISTLMLSIMGAFAEFERSLLKERQREGIELAKKRGAYKGRKRTLSDGEIILIKHRIKNGEKKSKIAKEFGISRETVYQYLRNVNPALHS